MRAGLAALCLGLLVTGCVTDGQQAAVNDPARIAQRGTIAFEAIDGPPRPVFDRVVDRLRHEADSRQIVVVSRNDAARYRVRGYLAASRDGQNTVVAYVWDLFDPGERRTLRISGEERVAARTGDGWDGVDEQIARRIASRSMERIAVFLAEPQRTASAPSPIR